MSGKSEAVMVEMIRKIYLDPKTSSEMHDLAAQVLKEPSLAHGFGAMAFKSEIVKALESELPVEAVPPEILNLFSSGTDEEVRRVVKMIVRVVESNLKRRVLDCFQTDA